MDILESEMLMQARLAKTVAFAALHANAGADLDKGAKQATTMYDGALGTVPYIGGMMAQRDAESGGSGADSERLAAVARFRKMQAEQAGAKT